MADSHLKSLVEQLRATIRSPPPVRPADTEGQTDGLTEEEREEKKRIKREAGRVLADLEEKVKDLEVEVSCAKAREDEAKKLVEEYARVHAETRAAQVIGDEGDIEKQRNDLEAERKAFSEATQRLGEERRRLEGERRALLEEKKRWNGDFMVESTSPLVKPRPAAAVSASQTNAVDSEGSASLSAAGSSGQPGPSSIPPKSPWRNFQPSSPSPLSPSHHKVRSPRTHIAGGKRKAPKTPLSRLVLEKAVLHRDKTATATSGGGGGVFGTESTRRTNVVVSDKGKGRADKTSTGMELKASSAKRLGQSVGPGSSDLTASHGLGPRATGVKAGKVWR